MTADPPPAAPTPAGGPSHRARLAELVARTRGVQPWRRVLHALTGLVLALGPGAAGLAPRATAAGLAVIAGTALAADVLRLSVPRLNELFFRVFRALASPREAARIASSTWYVVGAALVYGLYPAPVAVSSLLVLALADPAASVVGRLRGSRALGKGSPEGAAVFVAVATAVLLFRVDPGAALVAALATAGAEITPIPVDDNLTVPLVCGGVLSMVAGFPA